MAKKSGASTEEAIYRSGMAARLAGIPSATLRVWERRYQLAGTQSEVAGHRRYTRADVSRLALIKKLVDANHPIGSVARLPLETLREMAEGSARIDANRVAVALVGEALAGLGEDLERRRGALHVAARCADEADAVQALQGVEAEVLVLSLPTLDEGSAGRVEALRDVVGARGAIVVYRFGAQPHIEALRDRGHVAARAPLDAEQLESLAESLAQRGGTPWPAAKLHPHRFEEAELARLATASTTVACECPRHLVELVRGLAAFERYSASCAHRNARDAHLHREMQRFTSTARAMMEEALARMASEDGLLPRPAEGNAK